MSNRGQRPRIYDTPLYLCLEGSTPEDRLYKTATCKAERFIPVYRLGEDGDLLQGRWWCAFGLDIKSSLL